MQMISKRWFCRVLASMALIFSAGAMAQSSSSSSSSSNPFLPPAGYTLCAEGGQTCSFSGTRTVLFRACFETLCRDVYKSATSSIACTPAAFGIVSDYAAKCFVGAVLEGSSSSSVAPLISGLKATASTQSGSARAPGKAVDGLATTRWEASNTAVGTWLRLDLPSPVQVKALEVEEYGNRIGAHTVEYWNGTAWVMAYNAIGPLGTQSIALDTPATTAIRLVITSRPSAQPSISEIRVRGLISTAVVTVNTSIVVAAGQTYDGGGKTFRAGPGVLSSGAESAFPMFVLQPGAALRNVVIALPATAEVLVDAKGGNTLSNITWLSTSSLGVPLRVSGTGAVVLRDSYVLGTPDQAVLVTVDGAQVTLDNVKVSSSTGVLRQIYPGALGLRASILNSNLQNSSYIVRSVSAGSVVQMSNTRYCGIAAPIFVLATGVTATQSGNQACVQ